MATLLVWRKICFLCQVRIPPRTLAGVQLNNLFDNRKADAGSFGLLTQPKYLKCPERLLKVLPVDSVAVIGEI
jgi:hypothetical protein